MRWTTNRKAAVIIAIDQGVITASEAKVQYGLSDEELSAWASDYRAHGYLGLQATRLQHYHQLRVRAARRRAPPPD